jgi:hypothetical protein
MKYLLIAFSFIVFGSANAQTFEEKVADSSCQCIKKEKVVVDSFITACISRSMLKVAMDDATREYLKVISTAEAVQGKFYQTR